MSPSNRSERRLPAEAELSARRLQEPEPGLILIALRPAPKMPSFCHQTAGYSACLSIHVQFRIHFRTSDLSHFCSAHNTDSYKLVFIAKTLAPYSTVYYSNRTCVTVQVIWHSALGQISSCLFFNLIKLIKVIWSKLYFVNQIFFKDCFE